MENATAIDRVFDCKAREILQGMTLEEKLAQMRQTSIAGLVVDGRLDKERLHQSLALGTGTLECPRDLLPVTVQLVREAQDFLRRHTRLGIPALVVTETLHGVLVHGTTIFPQAIALASTWDPTRVRHMAQAVAREAASIGCSQALAPDLDLARDPRWGRVEETFGEDPFLVEQMGKAYILGMQGEDRLIDSAHLACTVKHFAAHGTPEGGINLGPVHGGLRELFSAFLPPFEAAVKKAGVASVMNAYSCYDGIPAAASRFLLTEILRDRWHFSGYIMSDYGSVHMLENFHHIAADLADAAQQALEAGIDLEAPNDHCFRHLLERVKDGRVPEEWIDQAVLRILRTKVRLDLWNRSQPSLQAAQQDCRNPDHIELAARIAEESIILLKNDEALLPLQTDIASLAVIGPNADQVQFGDYCWSKDNPDGVTVLQGLHEAIGARTEIHYAQGCTIHSMDSGGIAQAVEAAQRSQVAVVVMGGTSSVLSGIGWGKQHGYENATCGEGFDVTSLELPGVQQQLVEAVVATGTPTVVVLIHGRPHSISWIRDHVPTIIEAWYSGQEGGRAIARVLTGEVNPSGRLPISVPQSVGHLPIYYNQRNSRQGFYHQPGSPTRPGRDYVFSDPRPLFPFGHGLSYTRFDYSDLHLDADRLRASDTLAVRLRVHNCGARDGHEVVQLYVHDRVASVTVPRLQLKAFDKVFIAAGKSRQVQFRIPISELWLIDRSMRRVVEPGEFDLLIGASSEDIRLSTVIRVDSE
ncbi:glycoside hydrolase family 3 C-terminal domain-containing protein [candidate division KSB1 bacterium]|nr:glycoside hydrolase family 3 C-terminal domain-containing protein [candidate division KSB1 bacterium]